MNLKQIIAMLSFMLMGVIVGVIIVAMNTEYFDEHLILASLIGGGLPLLCQGMIGEAFVRYGFLEDKHEND